MCENLTSRVVSFLGAALMLCMSHAHAVAQDEARLLDQEPFDRIVFKQPPDRVLKVLLLDLPSGHVPSDSPSTDTLRVRPWDNPAEPYEIPWRLIERVERFGQLLVVEAEALTARGRFDKAFEYFVHLDRYYPDLPERAPAFERFLYADALAALENKEMELALASLYELNERNPRFDGLTAALAQAIDSKVDALISEKRYAAVARFLKTATDRLKEDTSSAQWRGRLGRIAGALLDEGRREMKAGRLREAHAHLLQSLSVSPNDEGAQQLLADLHRRHPVVTIGVTQLAADPEGSMLFDWAWRRTNRLLYRRLFEPVGFSSEGGTYESPFADVERRGFGLELSFKLKPQIGQAGRHRSFTGYDLSHHLRKMADPRCAVFEPAWAELLKSVAVPVVDRVDVELYRGHMLPSALLQTIVAAPDAVAAETDGPPQNGPFRVASRSTGEVVFDADADYFALTSAQPRTIVERYYPDSSGAIEALRQGEISALDRVDLRYLDRLSDSEQIVVDAYAAPTVHCLIPTARNPLLANRVFRRALVYAIPRRRILESVLLGGHEFPGCQVISGPFALGYAYDDNLETRPYDPRHAMALVKVALSQTKAGDDASGQVNDASATSPAAVGPQPLVLAHPANEPARLACRAIQTALSRVGLEVTLQQFDSSISLSASECDLVYAELAMWEPLVDARRFLRSDGLVGHVSPYLELALRRLDEVSDWRQARERLLVIHRFVHQDVTVIPLWQIRDRYARHRSLQGVGSQSVTLYQNVEVWQSTPPVLWGLQ